MTELPLSTDTQTGNEPIQGAFSLQSLLTLPALLRGFGSLVLLASLSMFLFQNWGQGDDLHRYWMLLGFNATLALIGFASGRLLGEAKGARTFLMLALAAVPINFTILGAFIYAGHPLDQLSTHYPQYASWRVIEEVSLVLPVIAGIMIALIVNWLGFLVLARGSASRLSMLSLMANSALLIPTRNSDHIAWLLLALVPALIYATSHFIRINPGLKTFEGRIARLLVWLPAALILARTLWLYSTSAFLLLILAIIAWGMLRYLALSFARQSIQHRWIELFSASNNLIIALLTAVFGMEHWNLGVPAAIHLLTYTLAGLNLELSLRVGNSGKRHRQIAALALITGSLSTLIFFGGITQATLCIANGLLVLALGYIMQMRLSLLMGLITLLAGIGYQVWHAILLFDLGGWISLATIGTLTILTASVVEKFGTQIKLRLNGLAGVVREWEA